MLKLSYNPLTKSVLVECQKDFQNWPAVRSVFDASAENIIDVREDSLTIPVWAFLSCRKGLSYVITRYSIDYSIDKSLTNFLERALHHENQYSEIQQNLRISRDNLKNKLLLNGFVRVLTPEQERNIIRLCCLPSGATFSVPGAGKTTEALAFFSYKKEHNDKLLVVSPKNAFIAWEEQVKECYSNPKKIIRLVGGEEKIEKIIHSPANIFLISYQQFVLVKDIISNFLVNERVFMFLDESHRIKRGVDGQWCSSILAVSHLPVHKLIMTGTPLPNSISDLLPQFNFIYPEIDATDDSVRSLIQPVFVRTTKAELKLPKLIRTYTKIELNAKQRHLYELIRSEEARQFSKLSIRDKNRYRKIGRSVMRLLQLVSNPALLATNGSDFPDDFLTVLEEGDGPKIEYACKKARRLAQIGQKTIIWTNFVSNVEIIAERLVDLGAEYIHGGVEAGSDEELYTRENKLKRFHNDPKCAVLVANPAACAEGISLHTVCHNAIYVDRTYNVAQYLQSEDRIYRLGLPSDVITNVEVLVSPDTIDESVYRRLVLKVDRMAEVLNDSSLNIEPTDPDVDDLGLENDDVADFVAHLNSR